MLSNLGLKRNVHLWKVGSKLVDNTREYNEYYWVITNIKDGGVELDAYRTIDRRFYATVGVFQVNSLTNLSLAEIKVKDTRLARKMYPDFKESEDGYLIIQEY